MDSLTHTLTGLALANAGLARRFGPGARLALVLASNMPDLDAVLAFTGGDDAFLSRRTLTHSVFGLPLAAGVSALLAKGFSRGSSWRGLFTASLAGVAVHVLMDLINSFGVCLLYPASRARFELAWMAILDLAILGILAAPLVLSWIPSRWTSLERLSRIALASVALYVGAAGLCRWRAGSLLAEALAADGVRDPASVCVFPEFLGPHRFRGVARRGEVWRHYRIEVLRGRAVLAEEVPTEENAPVVQAARETPAGRRIAWFMKAPVWRASPDGRSAEVRDLRFRSLVLSGRGDPFRFRVSADPDIPLKQE